MGILQIQSTSRRESGVSNFPSGKKDKIAKTLKGFRRMVAIELIGDLTSRKKHFSTPSDAAADFDTKLNMPKSTHDQCSLKKTVYCANIFLRASIIRTVLLNLFCSDQNAKRK